jgi:phenylacetic acid degradation protein
MENVYSFEGITPVVDPDAYVHPTATLIGDVIVGARCFVGPGAVMRGDLGRIILEAGSSFQDNCVIHTAQGVETVLAEGSIIGHGAVLHGCRIGRRALIGMNAVVMDEAEIGAEAIVGALAFVPARFKIPPRTMAFGAPVKIQRALTEREVASLDDGARIYQRLTARYNEALVACAPASKVEPMRPRIEDISAVYSGIGKELNPETLE